MGSSTKDCLWWEIFVSSRNIVGISVPCNYLHIQKPPTPNSGEPSKSPGQEHFTSIRPHTLLYAPLLYILRCTFSRQANQLPFFSYNMARALPNHFHLPQTIRKPFSSGNGQALFRATATFPLKNYKLSFSTARFNPAFPVPSIKENTTKNPQE